MQMENTEKPSEIESNLPTLGGDEELDDIILRPDPNSIESILSSQ
jgi:hypothetical protein